MNETAARPALTLNVTRAPDYSTPSFARDVVDVKGGTATRRLGRLAAGRTITREAIWKLVNAGGSVTEGGNVVCTGCGSEDLYLDGKCLVCGADCPPIAGLLEMDRLLGKNHATAPSPPSCPRCGTELMADGMCFGCDHPNMPLGPTLAPIEKEAVRLRTIACGKCIAGDMVDGVCQRCGHLDPPASDQGEKIITPPARGAFADEE